MGIGFNFLVWLTPIMCLINVSLGFDPIDNYLIDCGSPTNTTVGNRVFLSDNFNPNSPLTTYTTSIKTNSKSTSSDTLNSVLHQTARIFNQTSHYKFPIKKQGWHWIRLYFFPFPNGIYDLRTSIFSVSAQNFTLLKNFRIQNGSLVKEYSLNINSDEFVLTFAPSANSFAFLNALELVSQPYELIPSSARTIDDHPGTFENLQIRALETVARVNMGNQEVSPQNDTLWRHWDSDGSYLKHGNLGKFVSKTGAVNETRNATSMTIAPSLVYETATRLETRGDPQFQANMTWFFDADPGFEYLIRFHFCDIVSLEPRKLFFNVYVNSGLVSRHLDLSKETSDMLGVPFYIDAVAKLSDSQVLNVSVGPSTIGNPEPDGILNGLEIMKISNLRGNLVDVPLKPSSSIQIWVIIVLVIAVFVITVIIGLVVFLVCRRRRLGLVRHSTPDHFDQTISRSKLGYRFPLLAIQEATCSFSEDLVIGVGGFGKVYKGVLKDETKVAVKRGTPQSQQGLAEFKTEIEMLSQFRHRHLVSLIGYCDEQNEMIIIYEYMEHGTLRNHLYDSDLPRLSWRQRLEICIGSARGLHYLHTGSTKAIIHRDVKSANILLDENLMAKVSDFGLSKTGPDIDQTHVSTMVKGSFGYLDPEYLVTQQLTDKSDVYSFGVVMFEVLCGRPVIDPSLAREEVNLVEWVRKWEQRGELEKIVDSFIAEQVNSESLRKFVGTAEKCLGERSTYRPTMGDVLWNLECALQLQGKDKTGPDSNSEVPSSNHFEKSISTTQYSMGSLGDIAGISMSRVFSQMVREEMR